MGEWSPFFYDVTCILVFVLMQVFDFLSIIVYESCPENIQPFWISREPVGCPWCNLAARGRPYCVSVKSYSPVGLVSRQWDAFDWPCELCDRRIHNDRPSRSASRPFYSSRAGFYDKSSHHPSLSAPLQPIFGSLQLLAFPKAKIAVEREKICECNCHTVHKLSHRHLTADWLALRESDCSRMHSEDSSDWLPSCIKATRPVLEIFKIDRYLPDSPRTYGTCCVFLVLPLFTTNCRYDEGLRLHSALMKQHDEYRNTINL